MMQALVTGASGFIGSNLIRQLTAKGIGVKALLRPTSPRHHLRGVTFEESLGSLSDVESLKKAVKGVDYVFHLAGVIRAPYQKVYFQNNAQGTMNLVKTCAEVNPTLKRFVYVSSIAASGPSQTMKPKIETDELVPVSTYGKSKLAGEHALTQAKAPFPTTIVRPPVVYGPRDKAVLDLFKVVNRHLMPLVSGRNPSREKYYSLVHVSDLVDGLLQAGLSPRDQLHDVFFICGDGYYSLTQILTMIAKALEKKTIKVRLPAFAYTTVATVSSALGFVFGTTFPLNLDKLKDIRPDYWICSNEHAKMQIGFQPRYDLHKGIHETAAWYRQNHWI